ncbi:hypothetical protein M1446_03255 [Candidatus Dependentiae bacterium]|nr:hypothetical protein [Candidatus Dependentiae bacterium]
MIDSTKQTATKAGLPLGKQRNYNEVVDYLDSHWSVNANSKTLERMKKLDAALGSLASKLPTIFVSGTNGKSLTVHFTTKLLMQEGLKVGALCHPHILTYNERISLNSEAVSNKIFTEIANEVINTSENLGLQTNSNEILAMMAIMYFSQQKVDAAVLEVNEGGTYNPVNICDAKVVAITRATEDDVITPTEKMKDIITDIAGVIKKGTHLVSGDQVKEHLQLMNDLTDAQGGLWAMPIRKLAPLAYPFEQLHGRCAALAERLAQIFVDKFLNKNSVIVNNSLLARQKGQRGRPTLEAKQKLAENPQKTLEQFWKHNTNELPGRFQLLDKEKPSILLDTASNVDAFKNLLLGTRLLHYQRPLKGLTIIVAAAQDKLACEEFYKLIRYFFKKTSGQLLVCPIEEPLSGNKEEVSWDIEKVTNEMKALKVKAKACKTFEEAFDLAKKSVDERQGLVVITGSQSIVSKYWQNKGIKKF